MTGFPIGKKGAWNYFLIGLLTFQFLYRSYPVSNQEEIMTFWKQLHSVNKLAYKVHGPEGDEVGRVRNIFELILEKDIPMCNNKRYL